MTQETNELSHQRTFTYDAVGNLVGRIDRNGRATEFLYDALNRRVGEKWLDGGTTIRHLQFVYDAAGQMVSAFDPDSYYHYTYDAGGRATQISHLISQLSAPVITQQTFDLAGNRLQVAATIGATPDYVTDYTYDALGRMTRIERHGATGGNSVTPHRIDLSYDAASQLTGLTRYEDLAGTKLVAASAWTYDTAGRLTALTHHRGATTLAGYGWTYDAASRITQFTSLLDGTADYAYDANDQVTGATFSYQANEAHAYDATGNRTNAGYSTGDANRLLADGVFNYAYDAEGNRVSRTHIATGAVTEYTWDYRNRLTHIVERASAGGTILKTIAYVYDPFHRRIERSVASG
jgi:YD repeat-containing protein